VTAAARSQRRTGSASLNWLVGLIIPVALIAAWQIAKSAGALPYTNVPSPLQIWDAAVTLARNGQLQGNFGHTIAVCLIGWAIGSAIGAAAGVALGLSHRVWSYSMASVDVLRSIPAISFIPIAVIIFLQTTTMEISIAAWVAIWPVAVSTMTGVAGVSAEHRELAASLRLNWRAQVAKLALPTALPKILVALRLALSGALVLAIVAEIVGNPHGVGYALVNAQQQSEPAEMFAYILLTGVVGLALNGLLTLAYRRLAPGFYLAESRRTGNGN
jgi:ABC-type nitrate/sulfonate/bicarbonate transport system permease component